MLQIRPDGVVHFTPVRVVHIVPESLVHYAPVEVVHYTPVCSRYKVCRNLEEETPPRMWGRLVFMVCVLLNIRNTPTHVGKTALRSRQPDP